MKHIEKILVLFLVLMALTLNSHASAFGENASDGGIIYTDNTDYEHKVPFYYELPFELPPQGDPTGGTFTLDNATFHYKISHDESFTLENGTVLNGTRVEIRSTANDLELKVKSSTLPGGSWQKFDFRSSTQKVEIQGEIHTCTWLGQPSLNCISDVKLEITTNGKNLDNASSSDYVGSANVGRAWHLEDGNLINKHIVNNTHLTSDLPFIPLTSSTGMNNKTFLYYPYVNKVTEKTYLLLALQSAGTPQSHSGTQHNNAHAFSFEGTDTDEDLTVDHAFYWPDLIGLPQFEQAGRKLTLKPTGNSSDTNYFVAQFFVDTNKSTRPNATVYIDTATDGPIDYDKVTVIIGSNGFPSWDLNNYTADVNFHNGSARFNTALWVLSDRSNVSVMNTGYDDYGTKIQVLIRNGLAGQYFKFIFPDQRMNTKTTLFGSRTTTSITGSITASYTCEEGDTQIEVTFSDGGTATITCSDDIERPYTGTVRVGSTGEETVTETGSYVIDTNALNSKVGAVEFSHRNYTKSQLPWLIDKTYSQRLDNVEYVATIKEQFNITADLKFDFARVTVGDFVTQVTNIGDFNYTVTAGSGPLVTVDQGPFDTSDFTATTSDHWTVPWLGEEKLLFSTSTTGTKPNHTLTRIALAERQVTHIMTPGEELEIDGINNYTGQTLKLVLESIRETAPGIFAGTYKVVDTSDNTVVQSISLSAGVLLNETLRDNTSRLVTNTGLHSISITQNQASFQLGGQLVDLRGETQYPYRSDLDTSNDYWKIAFGPNQNYSHPDVNGVSWISLYSNNIGPALHDSSDPLYPSGNYIDLSKASLKGITDKAEFKLLAGEDPSTPGFGYVNMRFDGWQTNNIRSTTLIIGKPNLISSRNTSTNVSARITDDGSEDVKPKQYSCIDEVENDSFGMVTRDTLNDLLGSGVFQDRRLNMRIMASRTVTSTSGTRHLMRFELREGTGIVSRTAYLDVQRLIDRQQSRGRDLELRHLFTRRRGRYVLASRISVEDIERLSASRHRVTLDIRSDCAEPRDRDFSNVSTSGSTPNEKSSSSGSENASIIRARCLDSDARGGSDGIEPEIPGEVNLEVNGQIQETKQDICVTTKVVKEFYCSATSPTYQWKYFLCQSCVNEVSPQIAGTLSKEPRAIPNCQGPVRELTRSEVKRLEKIIE